MPHRWLRALAMVLVVIPGATALSQRPATVDIAIDPNTLPVPIKDFDGVKGGVFRDGRLYIAGQPDEDALRRFRELGVTAVVNLRTPPEMDDRDRVPFDEAARLDELSMEYVHIPLGGDEYPYTPDAVATFAETLKKHDGPILLHCTVAWRASYLWVAYLVRYQDFELEAALARGEAIAISPPPLEGLLGRPLTLVYEE